MKVKVINSSSQKTRKDIKKTFAKMVKEKNNINNITVTELSKKAGITRGTFYTHYNNIYEVAKDFQDEFLDIIINDDIKITSMENVEKYLDIIITHLKTNEELYKMILSSNEPLLFMNRLEKTMTNYLNDFAEEKHIQLDLISKTFFVDGTINLFIKYFREEIDVSLDDIAIYIKELLKNIFTN